MISPFKFFDSYTREDREIAKKNGYFKLISKCLYESKPYDVI